MAQLFTLGHYARFMNTNAIATDKRANPTLALTAFVLFVVGVVLPLLRVTFRGTDISAITILIAVGAEIVALILGCISWRRRLGKIAAVGAAIVCVLGIVNLVRFYLT